MTDKKKDKTTRKQHHFRTRRDGDFPLAISGSCDLSMQKPGYKLVWFILWQKRKATGI